MESEYGVVFVLLFVLGAVVGSFLNVVIFRSEKEERLTGRSHCSHCNRQLTWYELVPVFSYLFQGGKSVCCKKKLSLQYPAVELATGIVFLGVFSTVLKTPVDAYAPFFLLTLLIHLVIWSLFVVITVFDFRTKLIIDAFSFTLAGLAFLSMFVQAEGFVFPTLWQVLAGPLLFLPFYGLWKVSDGRWLGLGDGKLALGIGWLIGLSKGFSAILFSFWLGAGVSLLIIFLQRLRIALTKKDTKKTLTLQSEVPFGPFMVLGTALVYFFGLQLFKYLTF
jgi:prepilin signal peptidase PulO-like enzyme (type II secretory pathway)